MHSLPRIPEIHEQSTETSNNDSNPFLDKHQVVPKTTEDGVLSQVTFDLRELSNNDSNPFLDKYEILPKTPVNMLGKLTLSDLSDSTIV